MSSESLFCRDCGALLDISRSTSSKVGCSRCPYSVSLNQYCGSYTRVSSSRAKIDYNALYSKLSSGEARASVQEACPKCQHGVSWFKSVQMRSADEGETVFYECQVGVSALHETAWLTRAAAGVCAQVEPEQLTRVARTIKSAADRIYCSLGFVLLEHRHPRQSPLVPPTSRRFVSGIVWAHWHTGRLSSHNMAAAVKGFQ